MVVNTNGWISHALAIFPPDRACSFHTFYSCLAGTKSLIPMDGVP